MPYHQLSAIDRHNLHQLNVQEEADQAGMSILEYLRMVQSLSDSDVEYIIEDREFN